MRSNNQSGFTLGTEAARSIDTLIVTCLLAVAGLGILALSHPYAPPKPSQTLPARYAAAAPEISAPRRDPDFYPWQAPQPFRAHEPERRAPAEPLNRAEAFLTRLADPHSDAHFYASTHNNHDTHYGGHWRAENAIPTSSGTLLSVRTASGEAQPFTAAEIQTAGKYSYGRYEVIMRPARGTGLVSSFFTYTGSWFGDPHDEIDIEFLGKDTTKVFFNYFRQGRRGSPATLDLPFDAADADRLYAFEWTPEGVTWFIEGIPVYASPEGASDLPVAPGKIYMNVWPGAPSIHGWTGRPALLQSAGAHYSCVSFVPLGGAGPSCADVYTPPGTTLSR